MGLVSTTNRLISEATGAKLRVKDKATQDAFKALIAVVENLRDEINALKGIKGGVISHPDQLG
jgi:hypothetical protein